MSKGGGGYLDHGWTPDPNLPSCIDLGEGGVFFLYYPAIEAIQASRHVGACLDQGVGSAEFVPLLRRELELARSIQSGIARLRSGDSPAGNSPPGSSTSPDDITAARDRFEQLLDLERDNRRQLSRRGVVISGLPALAATGRKMSR